MILLLLCCYINVKTLTECELLIDQNDVLLNEHI